MDKFLAENPTTKRLALTLFGAALPFVNAWIQKTPVPPEQIMASIALIGTAITMSNWKEAKVAGADAAAKVESNADVVAVLKGEAPK